MIVTTLILKPCKSVDYTGKSIVYYYLQYTAVDVGGHPGDAADGHNAFSIAGHHRCAIANIDGVASVNKVNTNITNSLSQGSCQLSGCVRVVNTEADETEMPYSDCMDEARLISVMNWVKFGETCIEQRLIYIHPQANSQWKGFYWVEDHASEFIWHLNPCLSVPEGNLQVLFFLYAVVDDGYNPNSVNDMEADMYVDYVKDLYCMKTFDYGYTEYMQQIIDQLCQMQGVNQAREIASSDVSPHGCKETLSVNETVNTNIRSIIDHITKNSADVYDDIPFKLKYPTADQVVKCIKEIAASANLFKIDLEHAFRILRVDPYDYSLDGEMVTSTLM